MLEMDGVLFHQHFDLGDEFNVASGFPVVCQHPDHIGIVGDNRNRDTLARERGQGLADSFQRGLVVGRACQITRESFVRVGSWVGLVMVSEQLQVG